MASLIQQRMEIDRGLKSGRLWTGFGALYVVFCVVVGASYEFKLLAVLQLLLGGYFILHGVRIFRTARRSESLFTSEHGEEAGKQEPVQ